MSNLINSNDNGNSGDNLTGIDPNIDTSLGLGAAVNADGNQPTIGEQLKNNQAIYDSYGNFTYPFNTSSRYINRRHIAFHAYFYTQKDEYDAFWVVGRNDDPKAERSKTENEFDQELAGFHTDNQNKGIPTMQIYLFAYRDWEQILRPNDYVALRVFEDYPDIPDEVYEQKGVEAPDKYDGIRRRTLMVGLISDIQISESGQSGRIYTITCQGMQKVLSNITLGLPKEAQWNDVNLLFDINGASNPANESFPTYSKGGSSVASSGKSKSSGGGSFGLSGIQAQIASYWSGKGMTKVQCAAILGAVDIESRFQPSATNGGHFGLYQSTNPKALGKSVSEQGDLLQSTFPGRVSSFKSKTASMSSPYQAASVWSSIVERGGANYGSDAEKWYKQMH